MIHKVLYVLLESKIIILYEEFVQTQATAQTCASLKASRPLH